MAALATTVDVPTAALAACGPPGTREAFFLQVAQAVPAAAAASPAAAAWHAWAARPTPPPTGPAPLLNAEPELLSCDLRMDAAAPWTATGVIHGSLADPSPPP
jgi:hypothetical protein